MTATTSVIKPASVQVWWKKRLESLESLRLGVVLKNPSTDQDTGLAGIQNVGKLPPIPFPLSSGVYKIDIFYQSVSASGKKKPIEWIETKLYTQLNDVSGVNETDTSWVVDDATGISSGDVLKCESEIVVVTNVVSNTLTVDRGQHGTDGASHTDNTKIIKLKSSVPHNSHTLDGRTDALPVVASHNAAGGTGFIKVTWDISGWTAVNRKLLKHFRVHHNTSGNTPSDENDDVIAYSDDTFFVYPVDEDDTDLHYFWITPIDISGNAGTRTTATSARQTTDTTTPDAPTLTVIAGMMPDGSVRYTWGIEPTGSNIAGITSARLQISNTSGVWTGDALIHDETFGTAPISGFWYTQTRRTLYFRALVTNAYGDSGWATQTIRVVNIGDEVDTSPPGVVQNISVYADDADENVPGLELVVEFDYPATNNREIYAFEIQLLTKAEYDASGFPDHTSHEGPTACDSNVTFYAGEFTLTHSGKSWTTNEFQDKHLFIYRGGSTDTYLVWSSPISSNDGDSITVKTPFRHGYDGASGGDYGDNFYYEIVTPNWEVVDRSHTLETAVMYGSRPVNERQRVVFTGMPQGTWHVRIMAGNSQGLGTWSDGSDYAVIDGLKNQDYGEGSIELRALAGSAVDGSGLGLGIVSNIHMEIDSLWANRIIAGEIITQHIAVGAVDTDQLAGDAVENTKVADDNINDEHIDITDHGTVNPDLGSITAGTITGATIQTATSGARTVLDSSGITCYSTGGIAFRISTSWSYISVTADIESDSKIETSDSVIANVVDAGGIKGSSYVRGNSFEVGYASGTEVINSIGDFVGNMVDIASTVRGGAFYIGTTEVINTSAVVVAQVDTPNDIEGGTFSIASSVVINSSKQFVGTGGVSVGAADVQTTTGNHRATGSGEISSSSGKIWTGASGQAIHATTGYIESASGFYVSATQVVGSQGATISDPTGGTTIDSEARTAINTIIDRLQAHGLIA